MNILCTDEMEDSRSKNAREKIQLKNKPKDENVVNWIDSQNRTEAPLSRFRFRMQRIFLLLSIALAISIVNADIKIEG